VANAAIVAIAGQQKTAQQPIKPQAQHIPKTAALAIRYKLHCWVVFSLFKFKTFK
jgi:hypothetical protein